MHLLPHWTTLYVIRKKTYKNFKFSVAASLKILNGGYHKNQVICPHILYDLLHSWSPIHKMSCKYSHVDQSYNNFEVSMAAILKILNGGYHKNQVICPHILYDLLHSWPSKHKMSCKYSHVDQSYSNLEFSVAALLNFFNGGYYKCGGRGIVGNHTCGPQ